MNKSFRVSEKFLLLLLRYNSLFEFLIKQNCFKVSSSFRTFNPVIFVVVVALKSCGICGTFSSTYLWLRDSFDIYIRKKSFCMSAWYVFQLRTWESLVEFYKNEEWKKQVKHEKLRGGKTLLHDKLRCFTISHWVVEVS